MPFKTLTEFLSLFGDYEKTSSGRYKVRCRAHDDGERRENWSLSVCEDQGKILVKCFANCTAEQIAASVGLTTKDLFIENSSRSVTTAREIEKTYDYTDESENLLFQVVRYKPKAFVQRRPDGQGGWIWSLRDPQTKKLAVRLVLYRLPEVLAAIQQDRGVFIVEGEKDVETLRALGCVATCNPMGAGKWHEEYSQSLQGAKVVIIPDNDDPGRKHAEQVCHYLQGKAKSIRWLTLSGEGIKDTTDWVEKIKGTKEQLQSLVKNLPEWAPAKEIHSAVEPPDDKPVIDTSFQYRRDISAAGIEALQKANDPPVVFIRSGQLVRLAQDEHGLPIIEALNVDSLSGRLDRCANFVRKTKNGPVPDKPPTDVVRDILSLGKWPFPALASITECPIIREDGTIISEPGYDAKTELYYIPAKNLHIPAVPESPTLTEIQKAKDLLLEVIFDFPFQDNASRANSLAAIMTPILRPLINGPVPLVLFDAPQPGTGKSLLSDITSLIATGRTAAVLTAPSSDDEDWRKEITSLLILGRNVVTIDNIEGRLSSASLASVLTSNYWQDRILGRSEMIIIPHRVSWIGTGNNIHLGGDLPRRCYWVKIDAKNARPWQRNGFKHPHLVEWVSEHRGEILVAILTLAKAWLNAQKPHPEKIPVIGSFEKWCDVMGSILYYAGIPDFLSNLESMYESIDEDTPQWEVFICTWHEELGEKFYTVAELTNLISGNKKLEDSLPQEFAGAIEKTISEGGAAKVRIDRNFTRKLGKGLAKRAGVRYVNGLTIKKGKAEQRALTWQVTDGNQGEENSQHSLFREGDFAPPPSSSKGETNSPNSLIDLDI
jgi:5S rRNA maturation endonuclease (ribonuclease M5)